MSEYDHEPVRGLPGALPADEHIIWQSNPDWKNLAKAALHIRLSALYFGVIVVWAVTRGDMNTAIGVVAAWHRCDGDVRGLCVGRWPHHRLYADQ
ncbi:MAG: hypothetical protein HC788_09715 [Sphingopyxis sp.]|nr:hypothetical protein [Sphingopyxis sp.]